MLSIALATVARMVTAAMFALAAIAAYYSLFFQSWVGFAATLIFACVALAFRRALALCSDWWPTQR